MYYGDGRVVSVPDILYSSAFELRVKYRLIGMRHTTKQSIIPEAVAKDYLKISICSLSRWFGRKLVSRIRSCCVMTSSSMSPLKSRPRWWLRDIGILHGALNVPVADYVAVVPKFSPGHRKRWLCEVDNTIDIHYGQRPGSGEVADVGCKSTAR